MYTTEQLIIIVIINIICCIFVASFDGAGHT